MEKSSPVATNEECRWLGGITQQVPRLEASRAGANDCNVQSVAEKIFAGTSSEP